ncbi:MAG: VapC toxin family PIN domain ribonuclease [Desulfobulbus sp.]|nr:VapC toxin family PIN domain ribonuclease [Desulfobulbus sp.]
MLNGVLADTSIWVGHFRRPDTVLVDLLQANRVLMHPLIVGEIACGTPPDRVQTLSGLRLLQQAQQASIHEVTDFIERESLFGSGCGLVDVLLLASALITPGVELWTLDKRLGKLAERFDVMYRPILH